MSAVAEDLLPSYYYFPPEEHGNYVIGAERIADIETSIRRLHQEHWNDTEVRYRSDELDPDYERYAAEQVNGNFIVFTGRCAATAELVANLMYFINRDFHNKDVVAAIEDAFFVTLAHRRGRLAIRLLDYAERNLQSLGVNCIGMSDKSPCGGVSLDRLLSRRGYRPVALFYLKDLE